MKNIKLISIMLLAVFLVGAKTSDQFYRIGDKNINTDVQVEFETGDGASNKKLVIDGTTKNALLNVNSFTTGDGIASDKEWIFDLGLGLSNPRFKFNNSTGKIEITNNNVDFINLGEAELTDPPEFNQISNAQAETDVIGWNTYQDAAASSPVDGTGGSAVITVTQETSSPLRQSGSIKLTKDAANRQGEGISTDFTLQPSELGEEITITFEYSVTSNYVDDDIQVFVFNKDSVVLIADLNGKEIKDGPSQFQAGFTADGTDNDYRLIFHIASTSALSYDFFLDNVKTRKFQPESLRTPADGRGFTIVSAKIDISGGTPSVVSGREYGTWIDSLVDNAVGDTTININSGRFSGIPNCECTLEDAFNERDCFIDTTTAVSATVVRTQIFQTSNGAAADFDFVIWCHGPTN